MLRACLVLVFVVWGGLAAACPGLHSKDKHLFVTARYLAAPKAAVLRAGGTVILDGCASLPGSGQVSFDPSVAVYFQPDGRRSRLEIRSVGPCDTVLLVRAPGDRWFFDDDNGGGYDARVRLVNPPEGRYEIWVGTAGSFACDAELSLRSLR